MRLHLIRHGVTSWNEQRRFQGFSDVSLNSRGRAQADRLAARLKSVPFDICYTSPLKRAKQTIRVLVHSRDLPVRIDARLKEMNLGELEGLTLKEMNPEQRAVLEQWMKRPARVRMPGGETLLGLQRRAWAFVEDALSEHRGQTVAVVSHSFTIISILCKVLSLPLKHCRNLAQEPSAVNIVDFANPVPRILLLNDTHHLEVDYR